MARMTIFSLLVFVCAFCTSAAAADGVRYLTVEEMANSVGSGVWFHACNKSMDCKSSCISAWGALFYKFDPQPYKEVGLKIGLPGNWTDTKVYCIMKLYTDDTCNTRTQDPPTTDTRDACVP